MTTLGGSSFGAFGGDAGGVGNFKGVMLCNRPGAAETAKAASSQPGFRVALSHEAVHPGGRDVDFMERMEKVQTRERPVSLTHKIKAQLSELIAKKQSLEAAKAQEEARREERKKRLQESQAKLREAIRAQAIVVDETTGDENTRPSDAGAYTHLDKPGAGGKSKSGGKPAWLTSSRAAAAAEEDEEEDLLDFVQGFNPDRYEEELEDKAGEALLSQQIAALEVEEASERARLADAEAAEQQAEAGLEIRAERAARAEERRRRRRKEQRAARRAARRAAMAEGQGEGEGKKEGDSDSEGDDAGSQSGADSEYDSEDGRSTVSSVGPMNGRQRYGGEDGGRHHGGRVGHKDRGGDDAASIATSVLSSASQMRAVHSHKSMMTVVERTQREEKDRIAAAVASGDVNGASSLAFPVLEPPRVMEHNELRPAIEKVKNLVSNLPYQHRNPVI